MFYFSYSAPQKTLIDILFDETSQCFLESFGDAEAAGLPNLEDNSYAEKLVFCLINSLAFKVLSEAFMCWFEFVSEFCESYLEGFQVVFVYAFCT